MVECMRGARTRAGTVWNIAARLTHHPFGCNGWYRHWYRGVPGTVVRIIKRALGAIPTVLGQRTHHGGVAGRSG